MRAILIASALALAACQPQLSEAEKMGQDEPGAPMEPAPDPTPVKFEALSKTAMSFTGAVSLSALPRPGPNATPRMKIAAATGIVYETELVPGGAEQAAKVDWQALFNEQVVVTGNPPPGAPSVDMHSVISETIPPGTPNGGLCAPDKTGYIAMATNLTIGAAPAMSIAAFKGDTWPPKDETALCGTFSYTPPSPPR
jgi:hypothetical protein